MRVRVKVKFQAGMGGSGLEVELAEEKRILGEMLEVVEQRDSLVALLEEQRLREKEEDRDLESVILSKGFNLNWACGGWGSTS